MAVASIATASVQAQNIHLRQDNIYEVLKAMTIEEKVQLLIGVDGGMFKASL